MHLTKTQTSNKGKQVLAVASKQNPGLTDGHVSILEQWPVLWIYSLPGLQEEVELLMNVRCLLSACRCLSPEAWEKRKWPWDRNGPHSSARQSQEGSVIRSREVTEEDGWFKPVSQRQQSTKTCKEKKSIHKCAYFALNESGEFLCLETKLDKVRKPIQQRQTVMIYF